jgi:PKD repeat protein
VDGPHPWDTVDYGLSLLDHGTIWADVGDFDVYSPSDMAALKALIADGWELGIHYSARLYDLPLAEAISLMDVETAGITAMFGEPPTTWCSLQGADNVTHAEYAYTNLGMVSRTGVNGCGAGLSSIYNLGDNCWTFWSIASAAGIVIPTFSHQLDVTPAIIWSISADKFSTYVSNYQNSGVDFVGFREYWEKAQNSYHTAISNVISDPGVSLSFTVANISGKSRLLVSAPWATAVRDGSGGSVPFEVSGSGIVVEVEAGNYTVSAGLQADFSADRTAAVVGQAVQFTNLSMGGVEPLSYDWDFGDGTGSTLQNPAHSYGSAGTYTVVLEVTDSAANTDTETKAGYITVTTSPPPNNAPNKPVNSSPANGTSGVSVTPLLQASAFSDPDGGDTHAASRWQITEAAGDYSSPVFDSGADTTHLTGVLVPALSYSTTYYWHVRYQDNRGAWSSYSNETSFTTAAPPNQPPSQPDNVSPANGDRGVSLTPALTSAAFSDADSGDTHAASRWQVTAVAGDYSSPVFDSATEAANLPGINIPSGVLTYSTTYFWRVRHQDSDGAWSDWSPETSFATIGAPVDSTPPTTPAVADDGSSTAATTSLHAAWASTDPESGIAEYEYAIGTSAGGTDVVGWTSAGAAGEVDRTGLSLAPGTTYYFSVKSRNGAGLWSAVGTSDGIKAIDEGDTAPMQSGVDDNGLPFWIWIPIVLGIAVASGIAVYLVPRRPAAR